MLDQMNFKETYDKKKETMDTLVYVLPTVLVLLARHGGRR